MSDYRPGPYGGGQEDEDDEFALPSGIFLSGTRAKAAGQVPDAAAAEFRRQKQQEQELSLSPHDSGSEDEGEPAHVPSEHLAVISTYDKGNRGRAEESVRLSGIHSRIRRSRQKDDTGEKRPLINDSLLKDKVGVTVGIYAGTAKYTGDLRDPSAYAGVDATAGTLRDRVDATVAALCDKEDDQCEDEDEDEEDDGALAPMQIDRRLVVLDDKGKEDMYPDDEDADQFHVLSNPPRELLYPIPAVPMAEMKLPDTEHYGKIDTFQEYAAPHKGRPQFDRTMQHIGGKEQTFFVEVAPDSERYAHVSGTLNEKIGRQAFLAHAIGTGREIPYLPPVTKAEAQAARAGLMKGDCPCVKGNRCESYLYSKELIEKYPERYKGFQPWVCKEFYYGGKTDVIRQGIAMGTTPDKIKHEPLFCIMCHEQIVSQLYKLKKMNLEDPNVELHILHAYQYIIGPGEYPETAMLMGDNAFHGVAAPFIRYQRDNYAWIPDRTGGPQRWTERESLDFH